MRWQFYRVHVVCSISSRTNWMLSTDLIARPLETDMACYLRMHTMLKSPVARDAKKYRATSRGAGGGSKERKSKRARVPNRVCIVQASTASKVLAAGYIHIPHRNRYLHAPPRRWTSSAQMARVAFDVNMRGVCPGQFPFSSCSLSLS